MNRRGFLAGILASGFAPAAVGSGVLMPVRRILLPGDLTIGLISHARSRALLEAAERAAHPPIIVDWRSLWPPENWPSGALWITARAAA